MNKARKIISVILCIALLTVPFSASAEIVGSVLTTDIKAYVDHFLVPSYNIDGYTAVIVRDLENYGFTVLWDQHAKRVDFYKDFSRPCEPIVPSYTSLDVGTKLYDVHSTDIRVFYRGTEIPAYNIDGRTVVRLRDLALVGEPVFDANAKTVDVYCTDIEYYDDEIAYFRQHFYGNLLMLAEADVQHQSMVAMVDSGVYSKKTVEAFKEFDSRMCASFDAYKEYKEPYGFSSSALELWWAMVNMTLASDTLLQMADKLSKGEDISSIKEEYKQYRFDSLEQRRVSLIKLYEDMMSIAFFWN